VTGGDEGIAAVLDGIAIFLLGDVETDAEAGLLGERARSVEEGEKSVRARGEIDAPVALFELCAGVKEAEVADEGFGLFVEGEGAPVGEFSEVGVVVGEEVEGLPVLEGGVLAELGSLGGLLGAGGGKREQSEGARGEKHCGFHGGSLFL